MLQQIETQLKQTQITAVGAMDDGHPLVSFGYHIQVNHPNVSQTSGYQQTGHSLWVRNVALLQMEAATFLVGEEGFNSKPFAIPVAGFLGQGHIGDQINWLLRIFPPPSNDPNWAIFILSNKDIRQRETTTWMEMNLPQSKLVAIVVYQMILGRATNIFPTIIIDICLQPVAVKLPISQKPESEVPSKKWTQEI
jgi:hypothetical protein